MKNLSILFEDNHLLVLNKPSGLMVEEDKAGNPSLIACAEEYLRDRSPKEPFVANVHRLDRPASGVVLFAKKKLALKNLNEQFQKRTVAKTYNAISANVPGLLKGKLAHYHLKDTILKKALLFDKPSKESQKVELEYTIADSVQGYHLWKIKLITGKYHQIRAQLGYLNCPIIGDALYGSDKKYFNNEICLHSKSLTVNHPVSGKRIEFIAPLPDAVPYNLFSGKI